MENDINPTDVSFAAEERHEILKTLCELAVNLKYATAVPQISADYVVIETGQKQLKNAVGVLKDGVTFYTKDDSLLRLLSEHGLKPSRSPFENPNSVHNPYRYQIPHIQKSVIENMRPLFLTMVHDSIEYVRNPAS